MNLHPTRGLSRAILLPGVALACSKTDRDPFDFA